MILGASGDLKIALFLAKLLDVFVWLVSIPSDRVMRAVSRWAGALWFHVFRYRRGVILENLARAFPDKTPAERRRLGRQACGHLVSALIETLRIERVLRNGISKLWVLKGMEHMAAARAEGKGAFLLTGHLGSFEMCAAALVQHWGQGQLALVVKELAPGFQQVVTRIRKASGLNLIDTKSSIPDILRQLKGGGVVAFVLDQNATRQIGVFVDFFGEPASTMSGLALIALRKSVPIVPLRIWREDDHHVLEFFPQLPEAPEGSREEKILALTQQCTRFLEDAIRAHPEQWFWTHRRWKTKPLPAEAAPAPATEPSPTP